MGNALRRRGAFKMASMLLEGLFAPITSCFYPDGRPYWRKLEQNIEHYSRTNLSGLAILGSSGEAIMLSDEETRETLQVARKAISPERVLIAGVGRESVIETLRLAEYAATLDYDAVLVRTPHFYRPQLRDREMLNYYRSVADSSPLPVVLYTIPSYTAYELPVAVIGELAMHPNIIGIKDSSGNLERLRETVEATRNAPRRTVAVTTIFEAVTARMLASSATEDLVTITAASGAATTSISQKPSLTTRTREVGFQVLGSTAQKFLGLLEAGASGGVVAMADFAPQAMQEIYTAWKERDPDLAAEKQRCVVEAGTEICSRMGIPGVKYALDFNGYYGGRPRLPLLPLNAEERQRVEHLLENIRN